jgi:hypothetical protein
MTPQIARGRRQTATFIALVLIALILPMDLAACAVCYGDSGAAATTSVNNAIGFLLVVVMLVQVAFVALFWLFWKRAKRIRELKESFRIISGGPDTPANQRS